MSQTPNLLITEIDPNQNQKEVSANTAFEELDGAIAGFLSHAMSDADYILTTGEGGEALSHMAFEFTGLLSVDRTIQVPNNKKIYLVRNSTSTNTNLTVKTAAGTGVLVPRNTTRFMAVYCDGTDVISLSVEPFTSVSVSSGSVAAYTLVISDANTVVVIDSGLATAFTVPPNSDVPFPVGTRVEVIQLGAGLLTFVQGIGVTIQKKSALAVSAQFGTAYLRKIDTDVWVASGDLS